MTNRLFRVVRDIHAPPSRVWAVMSDLERWPEWTDSVTRVQRLDDGPVGVGSRVRVKQPRLVEALFEVTAWTPEQGFDWVAPTAGVTALARHVIEPVGLDRSRVSLSVEFSGPLSLVVAWLYGGLTRRYVAMEADGLKRRAEDVPRRTSRVS